MALVTLCPGCSTTFRVNAAQLQAHGGDVRCGCCQRIFNGFATLITVNESAIEYTSQIQLYTFSTTKIAAENQIIPESSDNEVETHVISELNQETIETTETAELTQTSDTLFGDEKPDKQFYVKWGLVNALLALLLMAQIAYSYRTELTMITPEIRPRLEQLCEFLSCTVPYPRDINLIGIESSELQKNPAQQPEVATMYATIHNYAPFPQAWPALQLSLLDAREELIASRIFTAQDYLQEADKSLQFIRSQQEIEVRLDFDSDQVDALGYRLLLLYP
ncbi:MAG: zinc-ribbon and DUF3426 domain-containing protein [Nitrosomonas sp.]|uniref:zinc-ribbon and DUF3426 domain-containing protein n=1 Tax=Nitrosomonas sp. TaxID=42353 RepID=UPI0025F63267|nr:zinc-ribbon and DUF3426 domain-containing protein [Nitrosomonas sp.]MBY0474650.1 zinc-ribbon and DUF3426 domain-containing protein [Nitrosomonas sp.]